MWTQLVPSEMEDGDFAVTVRQTLVHSHYRLQSKENGHNKPPVLAPFAILGHWLNCTDPVNF